MADVAEQLRERRVTLELSEAARGWLARGGRVRVDAGTDGLAIVVEGAPD